jgi:hypothetical protein
MAEQNRNEGEGSRTAARHYNEKTEAFAQSGNVEQKAREAADMTPEERREAEAAEREGKSRAKAEDPALRKD